MGNDARQLRESEGKTVTLSGTVSRMPWQHIIGNIEGKRVEYFDLPDGDQIVIYVPENFNCSGRVKLTGKSFRVEAGAKRPGSEERFVDYQLNVTSWECSD
jgi:hypothetical protein